MKKLQNIDIDIYEENLWGVIGTFEGEDEVSGLKMTNKKWFMAADAQCTMKPFFIGIQNFWAREDKLGR